MYKLPFSKYSLSTISNPPTFKKEKPNIFGAVKIPHKPAQPGSSTTIGDVSEFSQKSFMTPGRRNRRSEYLFLLKISYLIWIQRKRWI